MPCRLAKLLGEPGRQGQPLVKVPVLLPAVMRVWLLAKRPAALVVDAVLAHRATGRQAWPWPAQMAWPEQLCWLVVPRAAQPPVVQFPASRGMRDQAVLRLALPQGRVAVVEPAQPVWRPPQTSQSLSVQPPTSRSAVCAAALPA